jgi:hypothetical protein
LEGLAVNFKNGIFSNGAAQNYAFTWETTLPETIVVSDEREVYTGGEPTTTLRFTTLRIDGGRNHSGVVPQFQTKLEYGKTYSFTVDFKKVVWSGSNIYWKWINDEDHDEGGYLTFDAPGADLDDQRKQGVMFKWGSLVGISSSPSAFANTVIYTPVFNAFDDKSWDTSDHPVTFSAIEALTDAVTNVTRSNTYLNGDACNTADDYAYWKAKKGDICRYISENGYGPGGKYRMPTSLEGGAGNGEPTTGDLGWYRSPTTEWGTISVAGFGTDGTHIMPVYIYRDDIALPASGYRTSNGIELPGTCGYWWTASARSNTTAWPFGFGKDASNYYRFYTNGNSGRTYAISVRCGQN